MGGPLPLRRSVRVDPASGIPVRREAVRQDQSARSARHGRARTDPCRQHLEFHAFCPAALAGIGDLPDTIIDRSIVIPMRRRAPNETVEPFRERNVRTRTDELRGRLAIWAIAMHDTLTDARPDMPDGITDRPADVWEPLIAIGDAAGPQWAERARQAAVTLNNARQQRDPVKWANRWSPAA